MFKNQTYILNPNFKFTLDPFFWFSKQRSPQQKTASLYTRSSQKEKRETSEVFLFLKHIHTSHPRYWLLSGSALVPDKQSNHSYCKSLGPVVPSFPIVPLSPMLFYEEWQEMYFDLVSSRNILFYSSSTTFSSYNKLLN